MSRIAASGLAAVTIAAIPSPTVTTYRSARPGSAEALAEVDPDAGVDLAETTAIGSTPLDVLVGLKDGITGKSS
ncbi:hypothetical protein ACFPH6_48865 [Streptomyces xiangluensis]|uniref:Uncharacterized protein n=1 Tax=Streptomyces xiangluensis TaxID=2665720 RepID=A0ABV8Z4C5_9ACTN